MPLPSDDLTYLLEDAGDACVATINGKPTTFYGVFNAETRIEQDDSGHDVVIIGTSITTTTTLADTISIGTNVKLGSRTFRVNDVALMGDGALSQLIVVEV